MSRCPVCASDRMIRHGEPDGPIACEDCGFTIGGNPTLPDPLFVVMAQPTRPAPRVPRQENLAAWAMQMAGEKRAAKRSLSAIAAGSATVDRAKRGSPIPIRTDYLCFPDRATVGQLLAACQEQRSEGSTLLSTRVEGEYRICTLGSLLPYLTGRTPHIVHRFGQCPICSGLDPLVWRDTTRLLNQALADLDICARLLSDLPMAGIPSIDALRLAEEGTAAKLAEIGFNAVAVTKGGVFCGVCMIQQERSLGSMPDF